MPSRITRLALHNPITDAVFARQREAMEAYLTERHVSTVYHFTPIYNLPSICEYGLLSRAAARALNDPDIIFPDTYRGDGANWALCCSIEWTNYKMLYIKERYQNIEFAVLALDASLLWELDCVFVPGNAARADLRYHLRPMKENSSNRLGQLKALFPEPDNRRPLWRAYPQDVQSEVPVAESPVELSYCRLIYFKSYHALHGFSTLPWPAHIQCEFYPEIYRSRPDLRRR
jgi:ssDNA thymidine ADP-ribosyltransferase, DarT